MMIEFLTTCYGWDEGYLTEILDEDDDCYYFEDVWHRYSSVDKSLEGMEFIVKK